MFLHAIVEVPDDSKVPDDNVPKVLIPAFVEPLAALWMRLAAMCKYCGSAGNPSPPCQFAQVKSRQIWSYSRSMKRFLGLVAMPRHFSLHLPDEKGSTLLS